MQSSARGAFRELMSVRICGRINRDGRGTFVTGRLRGNATQDNGRT